jgi:hypothetical protein
MIVVTRDDDDDSFTALTPLLSPHFSGRLMFKLHGLEEQTAE